MNRIVTDTLNTAAGPLQIVQVGPEALDCIMALMQEASDWLLSRGITQWRRMHNAEGRAFVAARFETDDVYLVFKDEVPVATFTIRWEEQTLWGQAGHDGLAGYLHGFAVSRKVGGQGVGTALMQWVASRIAVRGRRYLRLNTTTVTGNPSLWGYYEREGFTPCGVVPHEIGSGMTQLFEREIVREG